MNYAKDNKALILFDAARHLLGRMGYLVQFMRSRVQEMLQWSLESFKNCRFYGNGFAYTIIPNSLKIYDDNGNSYKLNDLWLRRQSTKFNGTSYIIQKGAESVFTKKGQDEVRKLVDYYLSNAKIIQSGLEKIGIKYVGGKNSPYIWLKTPNNMSSWDFFHKLLNEANVVGTPGVGFGKCGEGYFRLTAFGKSEQITEAMERLKKLTF